MAKVLVAAVSVIFLGTLCPGFAHAEDVSTKKMLVKDNAAKPEKRQAQVQSKDAGVQYIEADDPGTNGASLHLYSATDDMCVVFPAGLDWKDTGKLWKYKNKTTKNQAQIGDGKLKVKVKSNVSYSLADDGAQGTVNAQVQFGNGTRYCMQCPGNKKDDEKKFMGKDCALTACDAEPSVCDPTVTTTTTTMPMQGPGLVLQGVLPPQNGRFNLGLGIGVPGSDAACNVNFPGSHTCTLVELEAAEAAGDLMGRQDINGGTVSSFWAIDPARPDDDQCTVGVAWDYATQHTGQFADRVSLNNGSGDLGAVATGVLCSTTSWVGCCF